MVKFMFCFFLVSFFFVFVLLGIVWKIVVVFILLIFSDVGDDDEVVVGWYLDDVYVIELVYCDCFG